MKINFRTLTLKQRLLFLPVLTLAGLAALQATNSYATSAVNRQVIFPNMESLMLAGHQNALKAVVDSEAQNLKRRLTGLPTREETMAAVVAETDPIRFFDDGSGYFFSYDTAGVRINVPINKSDNGKNLINAPDTHGYAYVAAFVEQAKAGGGFVTYHFEKAGHGVQPKLAYVKLIPGTDILVGAGVYIDNIAAERSSLAQRIAQQEQRYRSYVILVFLLILAVTVTLILLLSNAVTNVIKVIAQRLLGGSEQVAAASAELSSQSQQLAQGASKQAATIEETTASLEEMAGVVQRSTERAGKAEETAKLAQAAADRGSADMQAMSAAIGALKDSSQDIGKIVKTIDEIAFQTNILALNAAVEAARAGESGLGFAVVADEVRNLAQRSAQAARETTEKIEGAMAKTANGVSLSAKVTESFSDIARTVRQLVEMVVQVANASTTQSGSIGQINSAVGAMNHVTQGNAASAEESAAAAQQLNAQAYSVQNDVAELLALVGAGRGRTSQESVVART
jgi:methyl-accepting chemotaxis protein